MKENTKPVNIHRLHKIVLSNQLPWAPAANKKGRQRTSYFKEKKNDGKAQHRTVNKRYFWTAERAELHFSNTQTKYQDQAHQ